MPDQQTSAYDVLGSLFRQCRLAACSYNKNIVHLILWISVVIVTTEMRLSQNFLNRYKNFWTIIQFFMVFYLNLKIFFLLLRANSQIYLEKKLNHINTF